MAGYCTHAADMVLVINLFVTKNKFMETNFTTSKDAKISCKGQLKAVSVILCFIATIAMSCCFKQIRHSVLSTIYCSSKNGIKVYPCAFSSVTSSH